MTKQCMTLQEAEDLIGQIWEDPKGLRRQVTRIEWLRESEHLGIPYVDGMVFWRRPGQPEQTRSVWFPYFESWLSKAKRVA